MTPTREQVIQWAKDAGYPAECAAAGTGILIGPHYFDQIERLVYIAFAAGADFEREQCAKVCDEKAMRCEEEAQIEIDAEGIDADVSGIRSSAWLLTVCSANIRARGKQ